MRQSARQKWRKAHRPIVLQTSIQDSILTVPGLAGQTVAVRTLRRKSQILAKGSPGCPRTPSRCRRRRCLFNPTRWKRRGIWGRSGRAMTRMASRRSQKTQNCPVTRSAANQMTPIMQIATMPLHSCHSPILSSPFTKSSCRIARRAVMHPGCSRTRVLWFMRTLHAVAAGGAAGVPAMTMMSARHGICWALYIMHRIYGVKRICAMNLILPTTLKNSETMTAMASSQFSRPIMTPTLTMMMTAPPRKGIPCLKGLGAQSPAHWRRLW